MDGSTKSSSVYTSVMEHRVQQRTVLHGLKELQLYSDGTHHGRELICDDEKQHSADQERSQKRENKYFTQIYQGSVNKIEQGINSPIVSHGLSTKSEEIQAPLSSICSCNINHSVFDISDSVDIDSELCEIEPRCRFSSTASFMRGSPYRSCCNCIFQTVKTKSCNLWYLAFTNIICILCFLWHIFILRLFDKSTFLLIRNLLFSTWVRISYVKSFTCCLSQKPSIFMKTILLLSFLACSHGQFISSQGDKRLGFFSQLTWETVLSPVNSQLLARAPGEFREETDDIYPRKSDIERGKFKDTLFPQIHENQQIHAAGSNELGVTLNNEDAKNLSIIEGPKSSEFNDCDQNTFEPTETPPFDLSQTFDFEDYNGMGVAAVRVIGQKKHLKAAQNKIKSTKSTVFSATALRSKRDGEKSSIFNRNKYLEYFFKSAGHHNKKSRAVNHNTSTNSTGTEQDEVTEGRYLLSKPIVYIAGLFPWSGDIPAGAVGRGVLPAVHIALEHVNNDSRVERKYILEMAYNDTRCDMAVATRAFFDMMAESQTTTAMLFGDACYNVTGPMVQIAHQWDMFQLSYGDTNPMLSDRDEYPNFYRTVPSDSDFNPARLALLRAFNWSTVGTLFQDAKLGEGRHGYAHNRFDSLMTKQKINVSMVQSFSDDPKAAVGQLKEHDIRIIVGNFDQDMARRVFCGAYHQKMFGAKYQWIILGTYEPDWWLQTDPSIDCSAEQLNLTLHGYLATDVLTLSTNYEITESGRTPSQYLELYNAARGEEFSKYHGYAYDGVWVIAKALDRLLDDVKVSPDDFRGPLVGKVLNETAFLGVTGRVQFLNGDRVGSTTILQMQYGSMVKVGEYHALTDTLDLSIGEPIVWIDGHHPADRSIKLEELRRVSFPVYVGFVVMASLGITMAVFFLALNIRFRRHRYIKMSSPNMNNLIIVGSILCYLSVILLGAEPEHDNRRLFSYWCTARSWTLALGFTLAFGAMFGKTWRVHAIFTNIKLNKKVIKDYKLMLIVLVLVLADASILITWQVVDPFDLAVKRMSPEVSADLEIIPKINYCSSRYMELWLGALYATKGLLLAFGCFLAWETRHVSIPALNDSQYIGMSVYNVVIMCVSGAAVSFIIKDRPTQSFVIIGLFIVFCTTITLCLVFLPKIIQLKRNPKGDESRVRATLRQSAKKTTKFEFAAQRERMKATSDENRILRASLEQRAVELDQLLEQLGEDATGKDLRLRSSLMHRKILALRTSGDSPGKLSVRSYNQSELDGMSMYSEASAATATLLISEDWSPGPSLFKGRERGSRAGAESIELSGVRFLNRKQSVTIPPAAEEELSQDDPFGGVYLGPPDSPEKPTQSQLGNRDSMNAEANGEKLPLVANSLTFGVTPHKAGNNVSMDGSLDSSSNIGAQGTPARRVPPRSLRLRRHSSPVAPIWTIAESCLEDDTIGSQTVHGPADNCDLKVAQSRGGRLNRLEKCVEQGRAVTDDSNHQDNMQEDKFRKPGRYDNAWCEGIFPTDFTIKRVLEKFPDEVSEEEEPLMQPFSSPDHNQCKLCMTPPENQGLVVTPQTPLVPSDVYRPNITVCKLGKRNDTLIDSGTEHRNNEKEFAFPEYNLNRDLSWKSGASAVTGRESGSIPFASLQLMKVFNSEVIPTATNKLYTSVSPGRQIYVEPDYCPSEMTSQLNDSLSPTTRNHLTTSWNKELQQRPATPQPLPPGPDLLLSYPLQSPQGQISPYQNAGYKRKLQRSVSDPAWPCDTLFLSTSLTTSSFNQHPPLERDADSQLSLTPSVPTPTNGPSLKPNCMGTIRRDVDVSESAE